jgi:uncharacterized protein (TIGR03085 family)
MTSPVRRERYALCDTFEAVGPDAPTLCSPWRTRDLAAHLVIREGRPDAAVGLLVPPLAQRAQRVQDGYAAGSWPELVERVRTGPPPWSPTRFEGVDAVVNLAELFIHHEDVLRAADGWEPRQPAADLEQGLWSTLTRTGRLLFRRSPVGVVLVTPAHGRRLVRSAPAGASSVVLRGTPGELMLHASGRQSVARVLVEGPDEAVAAFTGTDLRL